MKRAPKYLLVGAGIQLICSVVFLGAAEPKYEKVVRVVEVSGTLRTAITLEGGDPVPEVFVTIYRIDDQVNIGEKNTKRLLEQVDGTFYQKDPLPETPDVRIVVINGDEKGVMFSINRNGEIKYRGIRVFADGLFEYQRREGGAGSFMSKELAAAVLEKISESSE